MVANPQPTRMIHSLQALGGEFPLQRWPLGNPSLRAWDGADRLLLDYWSAAPMPAGSVWVVNDSFGALTLPLIASGPGIFVTQDRWCERHALALNAAHCGIDAGAFQGLLPMQSLPGPPARVVIKMPKDLDLLAFLLATPGLAPGTEVWIAGMDKHLPRGIKATLGALLSDLSSPPGKFKAHMFIGRISDHLQRQDSHWQAVSGIETLPLGAWPGVFARRHADPGGRFLIEHLPAPEGGRVADLGCGNGLVGLAYAQCDADAELWFCDDSWLALESARRNWNSGSGPAHAQQAHFHFGDGLETVPVLFDRILLNPPFHQGHAVDTAIGERLIAGASAGLSAGGKLYLVINRHLDYRSVLHRHYRDTTVLASNRKFVVLVATV